MQISPILAVLKTYHHPLFVKKKPLKKSRIFSILLCISIISNRTSDENDKMTIKKMIIYNHFIGLGSFFLLIVHVLLQYFFFWNKIQFAIFFCFFQKKKSKFEGEKKSQEKKFSFFKFVFSFTWTDLIVSLSAS